MNEETKTTVLPKTGANWAVIALIATVALLVWLATAYWFQISYATNTNVNGFTMPMMGSLNFTGNSGAAGSGSTTNQDYQKMHEQCTKLMKKNGIDMDKMHEQMHGSGTSGAAGVGMMKAL